MAHEHALATCCRQPRSSTKRLSALIDVPQVKWQDRAHFFAMSSRLMRRILVDFARSIGYQKRRLSDVDGDAELGSPTRPGWPAERCRSDADRRPSARR